MTPAGWYDDPDGGGMLRWWDGAQWTDHRTWPEAPTQAPAAEAGALVHVVASDTRHSTLTATEDRITIKGKTFALNEIEGVQYTAVRSRLNGAYMGTHFTVGVRAGQRKELFGMSTNHKDERLEEFSGAYERVVGLLAATVCPRIARDMATMLAAGHTITLGPAGARVELTREGFRLKKPLAKVVTWSSVAGTENEGGRIFFLVRKKEGAEPKRHSLVGLEGENMVVLPYLLPLLR